MNNSSLFHRRLHFPWAKVTKALAEVRAASGLRTLCGVETGPGLWLVGDEGVYLMPNTIAKARTIVYARECDPGKLDFETWWPNKSASFGDSDGVEFISIKTIDNVASTLPKNKRALSFYVDINEERFEIGIG